MPTEEQMKAMRESHESGHTGRLDPELQAMKFIDKAKDRLIVTIAQSGDNEGRKKRLREIFSELEKQNAYLGWVLRYFP